MINTYYTIERYTEGRWQLVFSDQSQRKAVAAFKGVANVFPRVRIVKVTREVIRSTNDLKPRKGGKTRAKQSVS